MVAGENGQQPDSYCSNWLLVEVRVRSLQYLYENATAWSCHVRLLDAVRVFRHLLRPLSFSTFKLSVHYVGRAERPDLARHGVCEARLAHYMNTRSRAATLTSAEKPDAAWAAKLTSAEKPGSAKADMQRLLCSTRLDLQLLVFIQWPNTLRRETSRHGLAELVDALLQSSYARLFKHSEPTVPCKLRCTALLYQPTGR